MKLDPHIWDLLLEDEKMALGLQIGMDKSSWQAGEIMNKSHYKYLEIRYRAERFVKMFKEHLEIFNELIPDYLHGDKLVKEYFRLCLEKRMKPGAAIRLLSSQRNSIIRKKQLDAKIIEEFKVWSNPDNLHEYHIYNLLKDFDRWNNFRILPESLREPSAFKRRIKNAYKRQVKMMGQLPNLSINKIKEICRVRYRSYKPVGYLPLIVSGEIEVVKVKANDRTLELLTSINLYVFSDEKTAENYIESVHKYLFNQLRECTDGLEFWPVYRECIVKAKNYNQIQKITPTRKYLDMALSKLQFYNH